jgi:hypothetical protein
MVWRAYFEIKDFWQHPVEKMKEIKDKRKKEKVKVEKIKNRNIIKD